MQLDDPVGAGRQVGVVGGDDHGDALGTHQLDEQVHHDGRVGGVELGGGFVRDQDGLSPRAKLYVGRTDSRVRNAALQLRSSACARETEQQEFHSERSLHTVRSVSRPHRSHR